MINNNFFAILENGSVRSISLTQELIPDIREIFFSGGAALLGDHVEAIAFTGNYLIETDEVLFVELELPAAVTDVAANALGTPELEIDKDKIKVLFWYEDDQYYFQNFDNRRLLQNKNVLFFDENTFNRLTRNAFIVENVVNALYADGRFYFTNYPNANKIFSLAAFYHEATDDDIMAFAIGGNVSLDPVWFTTKTNTVIRKNVTLLLKSNTLATADTKKIKRKASRLFKMDINLDGQGNIVFPNDQKVCKEILLFLNEQYFRGVITDKPYKTNSKRDA